MIFLSSALRASALDRLWFVPGNCAPSHLIFCFLPSFCPILKKMVFPILTRLGFPEKILNPIHVKMRRIDKQLKTLSLHFNEHVQHRREQLVYYKLKYLQINKETQTEETRLNNNKKDEKKWSVRKMKEIRDKRFSDNSSQNYAFFIPKCDVPINLFLYNFVINHAK